MFRRTVKKMPEDRLWPEAHCHAPRDDYETNSLFEYIEFPGVDQLAASSSS
jgi:hypothetical protein